MIVQPIVENALYHGLEGMYGDGEIVIHELTVYAVNPKNPEEKQVKKHKELKELFPFHIIPAERLLGEDGTQPYGRQWR